MSTLLTNKLFLLAAMLTSAAMLLGTAWLGDDAFITLRVIDNFVDGYGLRYNVIERVQVFTHPLWLMLLTPFYAMTREPMVTTMLVSVALSLCALWLLATRIAKNIEYGCLLVLVAVASRAICNFSTSGLETPLTFLLLALFVWQIYRTENVWIPAGIVGLLLLNRLDMVVLLGPVAAYLLFRVRGVDRIRVALAVMLPTLAWMAFSIIYYGAPFPNTAYAKLGTGFSTATLILRGLEYTNDFVLTDPLLALIIGKSVFDALRSRNWTTALLGIGIVLYVIYTIIIGGDFMSGRFFAAPSFLALCLLARMPAPQLLLKHTKVVALIAVGIVCFLLFVRVVEQPMDGSMISQSGIVDERRFYYSDTGLWPLLTGWVTTGSKPIPAWGRDGYALKAQAQGAGMPIASSTDHIGMLGYYGGSNVHLIDELALSDPFLARLPAVPGSRVGHYRRLLPPGYAETAINIAPSTDIPALGPLLSDVILTTRAPLLAERRWGAIWRLLSGHYHWIFESQSK